MMPPIASQSPEEAPPSPTGNAILRTAPDEVATSHTDFLIAQARLREALFCALRRILTHINPALGSSFYLGDPYRRKLATTPKGKLLACIQEALNTLAEELGLHGTTRLKALMGVPGSQLNTEALTAAATLLRERLTTAGHLTPEGRPTGSF